MIAVAVALLTFAAVGYVSVEFLLDLARELGRPAVVLAWVVAIGTGLVVPWLAVDSIRGLFVADE